MEPTLWSSWQCVAGNFIGSSRVPGQQYRYRSLCKVQVLSKYFVKVMVWPVFDCGCLWTEDRNRALVAAGHLNISMVGSPCHPFMNIFSKLPSLSLDTQTDLQSSFNSQKDGQVPGKSDCWCNFVGHTILPCWRARICLRFLVLYRKCWPMDSEYW